MISAKEKAAFAVEKLKEKYPDSACSLYYDGEAWKLLVMAILSAQCTDARVNIVCRDLFKKYPSPDALGSAPAEDIEEAIRSCGLYKTKAANIKATCADISARFCGKVPDTMEELLTLRGVGRKVANLILGDVFGKPAIVTDTHCIRISERLGLVKKGEKEPSRVEKALWKIIPAEEGSGFCHRLVDFGREVCTARAPHCTDCPLAEICRKRSEDEKKKLTE